jgi:hypothetical protein
LELEQSVLSAHSWNRAEPLWAPLWELLELPLLRASDCVSYSASVTREDLSQKGAVVMPEIIFSHLIEIDESSRRLKIFRIFPDGNKQLYTEVDFPLKTPDEDKLSYEVFCRTLGENILIDSPVARRIVGI